MPITQISDVIENDNCIGCGACAFAAPQSFDIGFNDAGHYVAIDNDNSKDASLSEICPMSGEGQNETEISESIYYDLRHDTRIGHYKSTLAGHVAVSDYRANGSSGGLISWLAAEFLKQDMVDIVVHVKPSEREMEGDALFEFGTSNIENDIKSGAKSRYYPVTMMNVLPMIATTNKRFAIIGLPCFIKSIRLLQFAGLIPSDRIAYTIGLVCGHLKSRYFADYLAWQKGRHPGTLEDFDFRYKIADRPASRYGFAFSSHNKTSQDLIVTPMANVKGGDWGEGQFKNPACEFCDDVLAECADVAVGDAWIPEYVNDYRGSNIVVTRNETIDEMIRKATQSGDLVMNEVTVAQVVESQSSGLRHRRQGLAHRLARRKSKGIWAPRKRVDPMIARNILRRWVYDLRSVIADRSSMAFADVIARGGTLADYDRQMAPYVRAHKILTRGASRFKALIRKLRPARTGAW